MKYVQLTGTPDPETAPESFNVLAGSSSVTEARLFAMNISPQGRPTELFEVDGDRTQLRNELDGSTGLHAIETAPVTDGKFNLLVTLEPAAVPLQRDVFEAITQEQLVIVKPIVYRDERIHARIVGSSTSLQTAISAFPADVDLTVSTIGEFDRSRETLVSLLSKRQREAVITAFNLGYYQHPRATTHSEIAARLGCAPNTVSDHLQKAEEKIMTEILEADVPTLEVRDEDDTWG